MTQEACLSLGGQELCGYRQSACSVMVDITSKSVEEEEERSEERKEKDRNKTRDIERCR